MSVPAAFAVLQRSVGNRATTLMVQRADRATVADFRTASMKSGAAATLHHVVEWDSSSGSMADLGDVKTRERVSWGPAPAEFGAPTEYQTDGTHHGLGTNTAIGGSSEDHHSVIPTGFHYNLVEPGQSGVWKMHQRYEVKVGDGPWTAIPAARFEITRWFEREGNRLNAYVSKRGLDEGTMHRAGVSLPDFFV